jgi:hypothetical protein
LLKTRPGDRRPNTVRHDRTPPGIPFYAVAGSSWRPGRLRRQPPIGNAAKTMK